MLLPGECPEESFLKNVSWLDNLKLRVSYGSVGNDAINANLWKMSWASDGTNLLYNKRSSTSGLFSGLFYNSKSGFEMGNNNYQEPGFRILPSLTIVCMEHLDVYKNSTRDLLMLTSVSAISGFSTTYANVGGTSNKGIELALGVDIVRSKDFNLKANVQYQHKPGKCGCIGRRC